MTMTRPNSAGTLCHVDSGSAKQPGDELYFYFHSVVGGGGGWRVFGRAFDLNSRPLTSPLISFPSNQFSSLWEPHARLQQRRFGLS
jgi:hypothetical protein